MSKVGYIPGLDGLRGVSVLLVVFSHAGFGNIVPGGLGVTIFFFLSGYLITTLLLNEYDRNERIHIPHFYMRRFLRLFPPLIISLILAYGLFFLGWLSGHASVFGVISQIFYFANYYGIFGPGDVPGGTHILWSLAVEEHFYLFYPLLFLLMSRYLSRPKMVGLLGTVCVAVLVWRVVLVVMFAVQTERTYFATDTRIDSIIFGCLLAIAKNPLGYTGDKQKLSLRAYLLCGGALILMLFSLLFRDPTFRETARYTIQGIALLPIFYFAVSRHGHPLFKWLNLGPLRKLGLYSYSVYLIHYVFAKSLSQTGLLFENKFLGLIQIGLLSILYAFILYRYVDLPFARLRKKLRD